MLRLYSYRFQAEERVQSCGILLGVRDARVEAFHATGPLLPRRGISASSGGMQATEPAIHSTTPRLPAIAPPATAATVAAATRIDTVGKYPSTEEENASGIVTWRAVAISHPPAMASNEEDPKPSHTASAPHAARQGGRDRDPKAVRADRSERGDDRDPDD